MPGLGAILLTVIALAAVALIAWILAAGVESGLCYHQSEVEENNSHSDNPRERDE
jgi:hypothetical protein